MVETIWGHIFSRFTLGVWVLRNAVKVKDDSSGPMQLVVTFPVWSWARGPHGLWSHSWYLSTWHVHFWRLVPPNSCSTLGCFVIIVSCFSEVLGDPESLHGCWMQPLSFWRLVTRESLFRTPPSSLCSLV